MYLLRFVLELCLDVWKQMLHLDINGFFKLSSIDLTVAKVNANAQSIITRQVRTDQGTAELFWFLVKQLLLICVKSALTIKLSYT